MLGKQATNPAKADLLEFTLPDQTHREVAEASREGSLRVTIHNEARTSKLSFNARDFNNASAVKAAPSNPFNWPLKREWQGQRFL